MKKSIDVLVVVLIHYRKKMNMKFVLFVIGKMILCINYYGGGNEISLQEAKINFKTYRVSDLKFRNLIRDPLEDENNVFVL